MKIAELEKKIAAKILENLKTQGSNWIKPWISRGRGENFFSRRPYQGMNVFTTAFAMSENPCFDGRFCTFHQAKKNGGSVRKGERGCPIVFFKRVEKADGEKYGFARVTYAFDITQIEWETPPEGIEERPPVTFENEKVDSLIENTGAEINHGGGAAFFSPSRDAIFMPEMKYFLPVGDRNEEQNYYATLLHELIHWTGAKPRLERESLIKYRSQRPEEELIAEIGSAILCSDLGIAIEPDSNNAKYVSSWCSLIEDKPAAVFQAAAAASKAIDYLKQGESKDVDGHTTDGHFDDDRVRSGGLRHAPAEG